MRQELDSAIFIHRPSISGLLALLVLVWACGSGIASGQAQIRFPTPDPTSPQTVVTPAPVASPGYQASTDAVSAPTGMTTTPFGATPAAGAAPTLPPGGYAPPAAPGGGWGAPASPGGLTYGPAPVATLNGNVQPPPPNWDPFAPPGAAQAAVLPQDPGYNMLQPGPFTVPPMLATPSRFLRDKSMDYHWFAGHGSAQNQLGINDIDFKATFALPMPLSQQPQQDSPLLITPGFAWHFWDGPSSSAPGNPDLPPRTYDAYLDAAWNPVFVPNAFSAELDASVGIYSDFSKITSQSIRLKGKGMAVIAIPDTNLTMKLGIWYINRVKYKLLPAGGFVWKPSPVTRFDILFPNPKFTQQLATTGGGTEWWWYLAGEYGGGVWTVKRSVNATPPEGDAIDQVDYDDMRIALGVDFKRCTGQTGFVEGGYAFQRELVYASGLPGTFTPNGTFYIHAGVSF